MQNEEMQYHQIWIRTCMDDEGGETLTDTDILVGLGSRESLPTDVRWEWFTDRPNKIRESRLQI